MEVGQVQQRYTFTVTVNIRTLVISFNWQSSTSQVSSKQQTHSHCIYNTSRTIHNCNKWHAIHIATPHRQHTAVCLQAHSHTNGIKLPASQKQSPLKIPKLMVQSVVCSVHRTKLLVCMAIQPHTTTIPSYLVSENARPHKLINNHLHQLTQCVSGMLINKLIFCLRIQQYIITFMLQNRHIMYY